MNKLVPTLAFLLVFSTFQASEACSLGKVAEKSVKVAIRLPGSAVKASVDTVKMFGVSLIARLAGYRESN